ncbi:MAG: acyltransferase [Candidatus Thermoplasmatota archaeon]
MLHTIQNILFKSIYGINRVLLRLMGVSFGSHVEVFSITSIASPNKLRIGDNVWIGKNVSLYAESGIQIGNNVMVAKDVSIISSDHDFTDSRQLIKDQGMRVQDTPVVIGNNVWIGEKAIILKKVTVSENSIVGAGAVVTKDVPPNTIVAGNPAKQIGNRG